MTVVFSKYPLVEIVVELRWLPAQAQLAAPMPAQPGGLFQIPFWGNSKLDEFYMRLAGKLHQQGFQAVERLVPPGFSMLHQPIYRYKKPNDPSTLCQAGVGIFAVNGVPPYKSWNEFFPVVREAISALLDSRDPSEKETQFSGVSLRYIDAFTAELSGGRSAAAFLSTVLGISVSLPRGLSQFVKEGAPPQYALQLTLPTSESILLTMNFAEAMVNGNPALLMDTTASSKNGVEPNLDAVVHVLNSAHETVHGIFVDITAPIHKLMQPTEEVAK
ncbi:MAG TPA: TIGR04255 family protein [Candidatus Acidoferrales bacterium]|jgi:uncharacterized protein (TIGR04255 family)|nr:TIGR04255 family protein [Candidatus Acidoferrales bacterium]